MTTEKNLYEISVINEDSAEDVALIQMDAYPGYHQNTVPQQYAEKILEVNKRHNVNYYCVHKYEELIKKPVGSFSIWDFEINLRQTMVKASGIGAVAVDIGYKKEKVALELMSYYINNLRNRGINMAMLYPFNSAFYKKMGFGFGTVLQQFRLKPADLPGGGSKAHIVRLHEHDDKILADFYNSRVSCTHGLALKEPDEFARTLKVQQNKIFAYVDDFKVRGYIAFKFQEGSKESGLINDMVIYEILFDAPDVFAELMTFINSQSDQVRYVIFNTQDDGFAGTIADPRNHTDRMLAPIFLECYQVGHGLMYRICDVKKFFAEISACKFGDLQLKLQINVSDGFVPENNGSIVLEFVNGYCKIVTGAAADVSLSIDIAELSSLVMGNVNLKSLVKYGLVTVSDDAYLGLISSAFALDEKPVCFTYF